MPAPRLNLPDLDNLIARYKAGESSLKIAKERGISDRTIRNRLREAGVAVRSRQDYPAHVAQAHAARRGQVEPVALRQRKAATRAARVLHAGPHEDRLAGLFHERGVSFERQAAVGIYNLDFALTEAPIAVEVTSGGGNPRQRAQRPQRLRYLLDRGFHVVEIRFASHIRRAVTSKAADYVVAVLDRVRRDPSAPRQHWVVRCDGQPMTPRRQKLNHRPVIAG